MKPQTPRQTACKLARCASIRQPPPSLPRSPSPSAGHPAARAFLPTRHWSPKMDRITRVPSRLPMVPLQTVQLLATTATNEQQQHNSWGAHRAQKVIFKATLSEGKFHGPGQGKPWCNFLARPLPPKSLCPLNIETHGQHAPMWLAMVA